MIKILRLFIIVFLVIIGIWIVSNYNGYVELDWFSYHVEIALNFAILSFILIYLILYITHMVFSYFLNLPSNLYTKYADKVEKDNILSLLDGFAFLNKDEIKQAAKIDKRLSWYYKDSEKYSHLIPIFYLFKSKVAMAKSDEDEAEKIFIKMLSINKTRLIGLKGLVKIKLNHNKYSEALEYLKNAWDMKCRSKWVFESFITVYESLKEFAKLDIILRQAYKQSLISKSKLDYELIRNFIKEAEENIKNDSYENAISVYKKVLKIDASNEIAALSLIDIYLNQSKKRNAVSILERILTYNPTKELIHKVLKIYEDDSVSEKLSRLEKLLKYSKKSEIIYTTIIDFLISENLISKAKEYAEKSVEKFGINNVIAKRMAIVEAKSGGKPIDIVAWLERID